MSRRTQILLKPDQYLEAERKAEYKSEYFAGEVLAVVGASREHNVIATNLIGILHAQLRDRSCETYAGDMRVKVAPTGAYVYPDVVVVCGVPELEDEENDTLLNPTVIVEVVSPSTESQDRGRKWEHYRRLPSLAEYVLVAQDRRRVEHYTRQENDTWLFDRRKTAPGRSGPAARTGRHRSRPATGRCPRREGAVRRLRTGRTRWTRTRSSGHRARSPRCTR